MDSKKVVVRKTKFGKGLIAVEKIRAGELIASFDGTKYTDKSEFSTDVYNHAIQYARKKWRDSKGIARLLNHSCVPNCGIKNLFDIVAMKTINPGEELFWDYEMTEDNDTWKMKCKCGNSNCRKIIGAYRNMPEDIRKKYIGYISEWLIDTNI